MRNQDRGHAFRYSRHPVPVFCRCDSGSGRSAETQSGVKSTYSSTRSHSKAVFQVCSPR